MNAGETSRRTTLAKEDELALIHRANGGDQHAARVLIDFHKQRLFAFVWRIVRDTDLAEDICQETFLRAFASLGTFNEQFRFSTWLFTIGYRVTLNEIRARSKRKHNGIDFSNVPERSPKTQLDMAVQTEHASQLRSIIWREVDSLSTVQKSALMMFYRQGMSCRQIADAMQMRVATVKSHMHRARQKLRVRLERLGVDDQDLAYLGA